MRRVTAKPPNMLMQVSAMATTATQRISLSGRTAPGAATTGGAICTSAPIAMMLEMALVTLISGVCSAGVTFHTTMYPTKRTLLRVVVPDTRDPEMRGQVEETKSLVESLMGRKPELRFQFIQENAKFVQDIDV